MAGVPGSAIRKFLEDYILGQPDLVLAIKSASGASVNIDGPFDLGVFDWPKWRPETDEPQEDVVQPTTATPRQGSSGETGVHMHVPWTRLGGGLWVRRHVINLPLIHHKRRIAFYKEKPPDNARGDELFFFYAMAGHPLDHHPLIGALKYRRGDDWWGDALLLA